MDFAFSDTQRQIADSVERFLAGHATSARARASLVREPHGFDRDLWRGLAELGVPALTIPEAFGGLGLSDLDLCVVAETAGRFLVRAPLISSIYWASEALTRLGTAEQKAEWLPRLASGSATATYLDTELAGIAAPEVARARLTGELPVVADGVTADILVLVTGDAALLVELDAVGVERHPLETIDLLQPSARMTLREAPAQAMADASLSSARDHIRRRAAVVAAFAQIGGCRAAIDEAVPYAQTRQAFGRAIGSFQAVKHLIVNMYVANELARSNAYYAGWALAEGEASFPAAAAAAHLSATEAYRRCTADAIQVHGGIGFTWELDCHFRYRQANHLAVAFGPTRQWHDELLNPLIAQHAIGGRA